MDLELTSELIDGLVDRIALRVVEVLAQRDAAGSTPVEPEWLDAKTVAQRYGVSREFVYDHSDQLGGVRLGEGKRPRLRFPAAEVAAFFEPREQASAAVAAPAPPKLATHRRARSRGDTAQLLPIRKAA